MCQTLCQALVMIMVSKVGLCFREALGDLFRVANQTNRPILIHQWVLINFPHLETLQFNGTSSTHYIPAYLLVSTSW